MKLGRGKIAKSTVYPELKSIRALETTPSETWVEVSDAEAKGIRKIFNEFEVGDEVIIITAEDFCNLISTIYPLMYLVYKEKGVEAVLKRFKNKKKEEK